jgi:hypothetical protein
MFELYLVINIYLILFCSVSDSFDTYSNSSVGADDLTREAPAAHSRRAGKNNGKAVEMDDVMVYVQMSGVGECERECK